MLRSLLVAGGKRFGKAAQGSLPSLSHPLASSLVDEDSRSCNATSCSVPSRRWMSTDAKPAAPSKPAQKGGKGGPASKKKDRAVVGLKQPNSGVKFGHGAKNRPDRMELRAKARDAALKERASTLAPGALQTDDEDLQQLFTLINDKRIDYRGIDEELLNKPLPPIGERGGEELWQRHDTVRASTFEGAFVIPPELQQKVQIVRDDFDELAQTDVELSDDEVDAIIKTGEESDLSDGGNRDFDISKSSGRDTIDLVNNYAEVHPDKLAGLMKRGTGAAGEGTAQLQGREIIEALADLRRRRARGVTAPQESGKHGKQTTAADANDAIRDPREVRQQRRLKEAKAAASTIANLLAESGDEAAAAEKSTRAAPSSEYSATSRNASNSSKVQAEGDLEGYDSAHSRTYLLDSSDGEVMEYPQLPQPRPSLFRLRGEASQEAEDDALTEEQARQLLEAADKDGKDAAAAQHLEKKRAAAKATRLVSLSGDDSSDWGGDDADPRYRVDPLIVERDYRRLYNLGDTDTEMEELLELGVDAAGLRINAAFGDGIEKIPDAVLQELATPYDFTEHIEGKPYPDAETVREADMTPEERILDEQRKKLRNLIERPLPIVNRPIWPLHAMVAAVDQVQQVVKGGMIASTRCMIVVGNEQGGAGFGIGKHKEPFMATKMALANAQRDMIHLSLHKRQLYHDLIGKKNNVFVIMRTMPGTAAFNNAPPMLQDIFDIVGIDNVSAKIVGSRRREAYQVVQALFDGFHHHKAPEVESFARGLRMQWMGADRHNPRNVYPFAPKGPRYPAASERWVKGKARA